MDNQYPSQSTGCLLTLCIHLLGFGSCVYAVTQLLIKTASPDFEVSVWDMALIAGCITGYILGTMWLSRREKRRYDAWWAVERVRRDIIRQQEEEGRRRAYIAVRERILNSSIELIDEMKGLEFERFLRVVFEGHGYGVTLTKGSGDFGADLILHKGDSKIAVQAKRYSKPVGVKAIQEVHSALAYYKADKGWVITNRSFTKQARQLAALTGVQLIEREELMDLVVASKATAAKVEG